jgi:dTDP-4-amino-4,6-dideoxygalactose transaminase
MYKILNAFAVVEQFEDQVAKYTGAPYAVATDSCTSALLIVCAYFNVKQVIIPKYTYPSVPCSIIHAGGKVKFEEMKWRGMYQLKPYPIYDAAKRFTFGMYKKRETFLCLSFHAKKLLSIGRGGMILTSSKKAVEWLRLARYDGRTASIPLKNDNLTIVGWNVYMTPEQAARGLQLLTHYPLIVADMPHEDYPDLSRMKAYK